MLCQYCTYAIRVLCQYYASALPFYGRHLLHSLFLLTAINCYHVDSEIMVCGCSNVFAGLVCDSFGTLHSTPTTPHVVVLEKGKGHQDTPIWYVCIRSHKRILYVFVHCAKNLRKRQREGGGGWWLREEDRTIRAWMLLRDWYFEIESHFTKRGRRKRWERNLSVWWSKQLAIRESSWIR